MRILHWRAQALNILPVCYIFDFEMSSSQKRQEISFIFDHLSKPERAITAQMFGVEPHGYGFEHKEELKPLQAADILAWQMRSHMRKIWPLGRDDESLCHRGFRLLREDQEMDLGFFTEEQIQNLVQQNHDEERRTGRPLPVFYP